MDPITFQVTRLSGTERPWTGSLLNEKRHGIFHCICCGTELFRSDAKFDSGCGWPSFFEPLHGANMVELRDTSHGMIRVEIRCRQCDAHLGHVALNDGPPPTGLRYCINSVCLSFEGRLSASLAKASSCQLFVRTLVRRSRWDKKFYYGHITKGEPMKILPFLFAVACTGKSGSVVIDNEPPMSPTQSPPTRTINRHCGPGRAK